MLNQNCKTKDFLKAFIKTDMEIHYFEVEIHYFLVCQGTTITKCISTIILP